MKRTSSYIDNSGYRWKSYQEYCNSPDLDLDIICVMLDTGRRIPQNDWERQYVEESKKYKEMGISWEHPFD